MKWNGKWKAQATFACATLYTGCAWANMTVSPMIATVGGKDNKPVIIAVVSQSTGTQYVKVSVKRVLHPATPQEREELAVSWAGQGLIASPQKFALQAGATRSVRLVGLSVPDEEEVYRVYFEPVPAPQDEEAASPDKKTAAAKLRMNIVWGVLIRALPAVPRPQIAHSASDNSIRNTGNQRVSIAELGHCAGHDDEQCQWQVINRNIYPGGALALPKDAQARPVRVKFRVDDGHELQTQELHVPG